MDLTPHRSAAVALLLNMPCWYDVEEPLRRRDRGVCPELTFAREPGPFVGAMVDEPLILKPEARVGTDV